MRIRIISIIVLFVFWSLATWAIIDFQEPIEKIMTLVFISIGGYGVISATFLNIWNAWDTSKNISEKIKFDKTGNSFKYFERWDNQSLKEARDLTRRIKKEKSSLSDDDLLKKIYDCESTERSVITMFNFWEEIHKSITSDHANAKLLKEAFGETYCDIYIRFKVWRESNKRNGSNAKGMKALDELYKLWV